MKKLLFILVAVCSFASLAQAQSDKNVSSLITEAKALADADESIQVWECKKSGKITFVKELNANGKTQFKQVFYNSSEKDFVYNLSENISCSKELREEEDCDSSPTQEVSNTKKTQSTVQINANTTQKSSCPKGSNSSCCNSKKAKVKKTQ